MPDTPDRDAAPLSRALYTAILYLLAPLVPLRLAWRGIRAPAYLRRWKERFGFIAGPDADGGVWVHAVSVGEVHAAAPVLRALRQRRPDLPLIVTTTTPTGSRRVRDLLGQDVFHVYAPYDLPGSVRRFLQRTQPRLAIVMETEIWPNTFEACHRRGIALLLANGRMSERSARSYRRVRRLVRATLRRCSAIAVQSEADAERMMALGAEPDRITVTGSVKFDITAPPSLREQADALRRSWGAHRPVWVAGSTHDSEEQQVLGAFRTVRRGLPDALLVLAPRHPERFERVAALVKRSGLSLLRRSDDTLPDADVDCYLLDTLGELHLFYAAADLAFVGGSLVPVGGHNVLEPAAVGVPVLIGPHHFNFAEITRMLRDESALLVTAGPQTLAREAARLLSDGEARDRMGQAALAVIERNRGALDALLQLIDALLDAPQVAPGTKKGRPRAPSNS